MVHNIYQNICISVNQHNVLFSNRKVKIKQPLFSMIAKRDRDDIASDDDHHQHWIDDRRQSLDRCFLRKLKKKKENEVNIRYIPRYERKMKKKKTESRRKEKNHYYSNKFVHMVYK